MKTLVSFFFTLGVISLTSCQKNIEVPEEPVTLEVTALAERAEVSAYDNFYDDFDWNFTSSPSIPATPGSWSFGNYSSNNRWGKISWNWGYCPLYPSLASISGGNLYLQVPGNYEKKGAQIETKRSDYWYGSYRARIKTGPHSGNSDQGSVNGFFFYDPVAEQEIDVEILSKDNRKVHFVTHPNGPDRVYDLPLEPSANYIEYGFDWYTNKINFFVNGNLVKTISSSVPNRKGKVIFNHWTGRPQWGGTAPPIAANMKVDYAWHVPFVLVTVPDASGITWSRGSSKTIKWNSYGDALNSTVNIELWKDGSLDRTIKSNASNTGSYSWSIPSNLTSSSRYQIRIKSNLNSNYFDYSNNNFTIQ